MTNPKRVLIHLTASPYGGVETHVYYLSLALAANGADVTLTSQRKFDLNAEWTHDLLRAGVHIVAPPAKARRLPGPVGLLLSRAVLSVRLQAKSFDRVVGQGHGGAFSWMKRFVRPSGLFLWHEYWCGVPTHGDNYIEYQVPPPVIFPWKMQQMVKQLDAIVTGCERARRNLEQVQQVSMPIRIIPPLTHIEKPQPAIDRPYGANSKLRIVMITRIGFGKGVGALLDVWGTLDIGDAELHFHGPIDSKFGASMIQRYTNNEKVHFHGRFSRANLPIILADADLGLMLSIEEGYGLATWEYMACGLPFIMTDCGAAEEFTQDNPDAIMVPVSRDGIRAGIVEMVRRIRSGQTSRVRLQAHHQRRFSYQQNVAQHVKAMLGPDDYWMR